MVCRFAAVLALALTGCQQLPETDDDGGGSMTAGNVDSTAGGTFLDDGGLGSGEAGDEAGESECDPVTQVGCGDGQRCTAQKAGGAVNYICVSGTGSIEPFGACTPALSTGDDGCQAGSVCLGIENQAACVPLCQTDSDCEGGVCVLDPIEFVPHCGNDCSPFEPTCPSPLQCRREENRYACVFGREDDVGILGDGCAETDDAGCSPGFSCIAGELVPGCAMDHCCTPLCDLGGPDPCPAPSTCAQALAIPAPGFENVGACFVPA